MTLYEILNIKRDANINDIKKAYRKLSLKYHPDKNDNDDNMFLKIKHAYDILSDNKKREEYDETLSYSLNNIKKQEYIFSLKESDDKLDIYLNINKESFNGTISYKRYTKCLHCDGTGISQIDFFNDKIKKCPHCHGTKRILGIQKLSNIKLKENPTIINNMGNYSIYNSGLIGKLIITWN